MNSRSCRKVSYGCCSLGFVVGGTITVLLVLHVMDSYTATKDMHAVGTEVMAGYSSSAAHSLRSEDFHKMEDQRNEVEPETTTEQKTSEFAKASLQYSTKDITSTITNNKGMDNMGCGVFDGKKSCYFIPQIEGSFNSMTKFCKKHNMQMVILETWEEYKFISDIIKRDHMNIQIYVSLKSKARKFYWIYPNGDTAQLDYGGQSAWAPREPGNHGDYYDCVHFWATKYPGKWDD